MVQADGDVDSDQPAPENLVKPARSCKPARRDEECLHLIRCETRSCVEQQGRRAGHHCSGLRGTAASEQSVGHETLGVLQIDPAERCAQAVDVSTWGCDVRATVAVATGRPRRYPELVDGQRLGGHRDNHPWIDGGALRCRSGRHRSRRTTNTMPLRPARSPRQRAVLRPDTWKPLRRSKACFNSPVVGDPVDAGDPLTDVDGTGLRPPHRHETASGPPRTIGMGSL